MVRLCLSDTGCCAGGTLRAYLSAIRLATLPKALPLRQTQNAYSYAPSLGGIFVLLVLLKLFNFILEAKCTIIFMYF